MSRLGLLAVAVALGGCALFDTTPPEPALVAAPHYLIGAPYQVGGVWQYPGADFSADLTGLAGVAPDRAGLTADGEIFDQTALAAGHRALQLPAILRVTNLENGRQILVRLNDRGPDHPGRLLSLTRRAAELLAVQAPVVRVRVQVVEDQSRLLALSMQGSGPALTVAAAPRDDVAVESLAPPDGIGQSGRGRVAATRAAPMASSAGVEAGTVPLRLPEEIRQVYASPGSLYIDAGTFSRADAASIRSNQLIYLGARITTRFTAPRVRAYHVRIGPLADVAAADAMLQRALSAGVPDAAIIVE